MVTTHRKRMVRTAAHLAETMREGSPQDVADIAAELIKAASDIRRDALAELPFRVPSALERVPVVLNEREAWDLLTGMTAESMAECNPGALDDAPSPVCERGCLP
jgi:hypothetical protein